MGACFLTGGQKELLGLSQWHEPIHCVYIGVVKDWEHHRRIPLLGGRKVEVGWIMKVTTSARMGESFASENLQVL
jgi:hypothetical protein